MLRARTIDEALIREVLALLAEVDAPPPSDYEAGDRVGPYRVVREVGRGGMGRVYLASRADGQFEQTVALKAIKRGMDSEAVLRRFHQERQILARLQHPAIARLLGGGVADDGRPYFAMEYVQGTTIRAHCDQHGLSVDRRLALFEQVCDAVAYAHRNLVVHRDLKPSNILVTPEGQVKLLDFGIARLLDTDDPAITVADARPMTLDYAAPEQVRGGAVTTATDVYALGVLLYELLAGRRPYDTDGRDGYDVQRAIVEDDPRRPSTVVLQPPPTRTPTTRTQDTGATHGLAPRRLRRRLTGDLDQIALKALRKDPDGRYQTAEALRDDVARHRAGLPVLARPATLGYRLRAFARRHRAGVATGAVAALLLVGTVAFYTARLADERDRAQQEAHRAQETALFLRTLFEGADPSVARGTELTARDLLDQGRRRVEDQLRETPRVQAEMLGLIGEVYASLGLYPAADSALTRAFELRRAVGEALPEAHAAAALGAVRLSQGRHAEAESLLTGALRVQRTLAPGPTDEAASMLETLGELRQEAGDLLGAEAPFREALAMRRALVREGDDAGTAAVLHDLALTLYDLAEYDEAERHYADALAMRRRLFGDLHPDVARTLRGYSALLRRRDRFDEAEPLIREALRLDSVLVGPMHPMRGEDLYELASLLKDQGRYAEAAAVFEQGLEVDLATLGPDHPYTALTLSEIGQTRLRMGEPDVALGYYDRALAIQRAALAPDHPEIATTLTKVGDVYTALGRFGDAEAAYRRTVAIRKATLGPDHPQTLKDENRVGIALVRAGRLRDGIAYADALDARAAAVLEADDAVWANSRMGFVSALRASGTRPALEAARIRAAREVAQFRRLFPAPSRLLGIALLEEAQAFRLLGDAGAAAPLYREAHDNLAAALGSDHPTTRRAAAHLPDASR